MLTMKDRHKTRYRAKRKLLVFAVGVVFLLTLRSFMAIANIEADGSKDGTTSSTSDSPSNPRQPNVFHPSLSNTTTSVPTISTNYTDTNKPWKYFPWKMSPSHNTIPTKQEHRWAVMVISMGQQASKFRIVERIWLSLRRRGDYFGPMVVLTDADPDRYLGILEADPYFLAIRPHSTDYNWDPNYVDEAMPYKRFKTYLIDYIQEGSNDERLANVEYILYLDADVVVGQSLKEWLDFCEKQLSAAIDSTNPSILFFEGNFDDMPIQSGQFALSVPRAVPCLKGWREIMDLNPGWKKDQYSLKALQDKRHTNHCSMAVIGQDPWLYFVKKTNLDRIVSKKNYSPLLHIQNTGHARYMRDHSVQKLFRDLLQLSPEEAQLNWKTPIKASRQWSLGQVNGHDTDEVNTE